MAFHIRNLFSLVSASTCFPNEVKAIRELGGRIVRVDRGEEPIWWKHAVATCEGDIGARAIMETSYADIHASEWAWAAETPDELIHNNGTLEELYGMVGLLSNRYNF